MKAARGKVSRGCWRWRTASFPLLAGKKGKSEKFPKFGRANPSTAAAWGSTHLSSAQLALKHLEDKLKTAQINRIYFRLQVGGGMGVKKEGKKKKKSGWEKDGESRLSRTAMSRRRSLPARRRFVVSDKLNITVYYQPYSNKIKRVAGDSCYLTSFAPIGHGDVTSHATGLFCHG